MYYDYYRSSIASVCLAGSTWSAAVSSHCQPAIQTTAGRQRAVASAHSTAEQGQTVDGYE